MLANFTYDFTAELWQYPGPGSWHFLTLPEPLSNQIKERFGAAKRRGWGAIPVTVTVGSSTWPTSIFPSKEHGYILAVKKDVREREGLEDGNQVATSLAVREM